jgi:D-alanine-D-alanine ligase
MSLPESAKRGRRLRVAVLMGGTSSEREVSLVSGRMIAEALDPEWYDVVALDTRDLLRLPADFGGGLPPAEAEGEASNPPTAWADALSSTGGAGATAADWRGETGLDRGRDGAIERAPGTAAPARPDVVLIALHGKGGEDGTVQGMLELMGLPYTGSGVLASALAMDKVMSKRLFQAAGVPVIEGIYITRERFAGCTEEEFRSASLRDVETRLGFPVFVKPNAGGSTCGCALVERPETLFAAVQEALEFDDTALIERYVRGMEITVGVLDFVGEPPLALPVIEIVPKGEYYDYESKYAPGGSEHIIPARLPHSVIERAQEIARECHEVLGCRGMSRTDLIAADDGLYVLEVNTIPGMTPTSLLPQAAEHAGISFSQLLDRLIRSAVGRR